MPRTKFSLSTLSELEMGRISDEMQDHIRRAVSDCRLRPAARRGRKVTLEISMEPKIGPEGQCESIVARFGIKSTTPKAESHAIDMGFNVNGDLWFTPDTDGTPHDGT